MKSLCNQRSTSDWKPFLGNWCPQNPDYIRGNLYFRNPFLHKNPTLGQEVGTCINSEVYVFIYLQVASMQRSFLFITDFMGYIYYIYTPHKTDQIYYTGIERLTSDWKPFVSLKEVIKIALKSLNFNVNRGFFEVR